MKGEKFIEENDVESDDSTARSDDIILLDSVSGRRGRIVTEQLFLCKQNDRVSRNELVNVKISKAVRDEDCTGSSMGSLMWPKKGREAATAKRTNSRASTVAHTSEKPGRDETQRSEVKNDSSGVIFNFVSQLSLLGFGSTAWVPQAVSNKSQRCIEPAKVGKEFFEKFPPWSLHGVFHFLHASEIWKLRGVSCWFKKVVEDIPGAFCSCTTLILGRSWAAASIEIRQRALVQMKKLHILVVEQNAFIKRPFMTEDNENMLNNSCEERGLTIQEVAAIIALNHQTLRKIVLNSPEHPLDDGTPSHVPFSFRPMKFGELFKLSIVGSQAFEWCHIFTNCFFPRLTRFELSSFPISPKHWSWDVLPDYTLLGLRGAQRMLDRMPLLERLTLGLDIRTEPTDDNAVGANMSDTAAADLTSSFHDAHRDGAISRSSGLASQSSSPTGHSDAVQEAYPVSEWALGNGLYYQEFHQTNEDRGNYILGWTLRNTAPRDVTEPQPVGGRCNLTAWRGCISEVDLADLLAIAYVRAGGTGSLRRIVMKHKTRERKSDDEDEDRTSLGDILHGAAAFCYRYMSGVLDGVGRPGVLNSE